MFFFLISTLRTCRNWFKRWIPTKSSSTWICSHKHMLLQTFLEKVHKNNRWFKSSNSTQQNAHNLSWSLWIIPLLANWIFEGNLSNTTLHPNTLSFDIIRVLQNLFRASKPFESTTFQLVSRGEKNNTLQKKVYYHG